MEGIQALKNGSLYITKVITSLLLELAKLNSCTKRIALSVKKIYRDGANIYSFIDAMFYVDWERE